MCKYWKLFYYLHNDDFVTVNSNIQLLFQYHFKAEAIMDYSIKTQSKNPNIRGDPKKQKENLTLKVLKA